MAQYFTDFSEYTAGEQPSDWTRRFAASFTWLVDNESGASGGKIIKGFSEPSTDRNALSWDVIDSDPDRAEVEVYTRVRFPDALHSAELLCMTRGSGAAGSENVYRHGARPFNSRYELARYSNGNYSTIASVEGINFSVGVWYDIRVQSIGSEQRVKVWPSSDPEPLSWDIESSDTSIAGPGWVGLFRFRTDPIDVDVFSVGTNGDPAPTEPAGGDTTVNPTTATSTSDSPNPAIASGASVTATTANSTSEAIAPAVSAGASVSPTVAESTSTAIDPAISSGASASPTVASSTGNTLEPQVTTDQSVLVEPTAAESVSVSPDPVISTGAAIQPTTAGSVSAANDPVIGIAVVVRPTAAQSVSEPLAPTATSGASALPATVYSESAANDPLVSTAANVFPFTARSTGKSLDPLVSGGLDRYVAKKTINGVYYRNVSLRGEYPRRLTLRS